MKTPLVKIAWRTFLVVCLAVLTVGILAPFLSANAFREPIRRALETALNRQVAIGQVHFSVFRGPGFSVSDVLISDEPSAGIEPFAHVDTLQARVHLLKTLWTRKLVFSTLRLVDPSVNLVKTDSGGWNIDAFLRRATSPSSPHNPHASFPDIQVSDGRLDFKFGLAKSVFYISNADADIYPNENGDLVVRFSGEPARTDRGAQGFGRFSARGLLHNSGAQDELNMVLQLERSSLSELARLVNAGDIGVHGYVSSNATLSGPLSRIRISGNLNMSDLHRWDLMPAQGEGWTIGYRGELNVPGQRLELETVSDSRGSVPVSMRFKASDLISAPKWAASVTLDDLPAASLVETARHMGVPLPANVRVDGKVRGAIGVSNPGGFAGELGFHDASLAIPDAGSAHLESAVLVIGDRQVRLDPAEITFEGGSTASIEGVYAAADHSLSATLSARALKIADLITGPARLLHTAAIPVVQNCRQGSWTGRLRYQQAGDDSPRVSGEFELQNAVMEVPGVAAPLRIASAAVEVEGDRIQIKNLRGHAGALDLQADYRFSSGPGSHHIRLVLPQADLAQIERFFLPTLRRSQGFFANLRLRRTALPDWLKQRDIQGTVQIAKLMQDGESVCTFNSRLNWSGALVQLTNATCQQEDTHISGKVMVNLAGARPQYKVIAKVEDLDYRSGAIDIDGTLETSGTGSEFLANAQSAGTFEGRDVRLSAETVFQEISGAYELTPGSLGPRLVLTKVQATDGIDALAGQGSTQADGHLVLELTAGKKQVRLVGSVLPLRVPPAP